VQFLNVKTQPGGKKGICASRQYIAFLLSLAWLPQSTHCVPADEAFLCNEAAVLGVAIKETPWTLIRRGFKSPRKHVYKDAPSRVVELITSRVLFMDRWLTFVSIHWVREFALDIARLLRRKVRHEKLTPCKSKRRQKMMMSLQQRLPPQQLWGAFAKLQKAIVKFMSVRPSVRLYAWNNLSSTGRILM
jgi:hypothetical protein